MYDNFKSVISGLLNININENIALKFENKKPNFFLEDNFLTIGLDVSSFHFLALKACLRLCVKAKTLCRVRSSGEVTSGQVATEGIANAVPVNTGRQGKVPPKKRVQKQIVLIYYMVSRL